MAWKFFTNTGQLKTTPGSFFAPTMLGAYGGGTGSTFFSASAAALIPLAGVVVPTTFTRFGFAVTTASGNMDVGVYYSDDEATFTKLVSTGTFAVPAAGSILKTVAATTITPAANRRWYLAMACDNAVAAFINISQNVSGGYFKAASFVLPASLTAMTAFGAASNTPAIQILV